MALALALALPARARADQTFVLETTDPFSGTGSIAILQATPNGDGSFNPTSGFLCMLSGPYAGMYDLVPNPNPPFFVPFPSGFSFYDNQLFPGQDAVVDVGGLLFAGNGLEINIWSAGPGFYVLWVVKSPSLLLNTSTQLSLVSGSDATGLIALEKSMVIFLGSIGVLPQGAVITARGQLDLARTAVGAGRNGLAITTLEAFINSTNSYPPGVGACLSAVAQLAILDLGG
jgi:hypothetical protein